MRPRWLRRRPTPEPTIDERVAPLIDAHHDTHLLAQHAADLAASTNSDLEGLRPGIDELYRRTDSEEEKLAVLHDHAQRLERIERWQAIESTTRFLDHLVDDPVTTISVILPTRNRAHRLPDAIRSVVEQRYERWELLIIDDGSVDDTAALLDKYDDPRIRCLRTDGLGVCAARNHGIDHVEGSIVTYLDDDNRMDRLWLSAVAWAFQSRPDTALLYGGRVIDDLRLLHDGEPGGFPEHQFEPFDRARLERGNFIDIGVIAHRAGLDVRFDESLVVLGDWDLVLQLTATTVPLELPAVAVYYSTDEPDRLSGRRNAYYLPEHEDDVQRIRRRHASAAPDEPSD